MGFDFEQSLKKLHSEPKEEMNIHTKLANIVNSKIEEQPEPERIKTEPSTVERAIKKHSNLHISLKSTVKK
jgi:hypothetical protein